MKVCTRCGGKKPLLEFYIHKRGRAEGKPRAECKACGKKIQKLRNSTRTEKNTLAKRAWRKNNPEKNVASAKAWHQKNRKRSQQKRKLWEAANPGKTTEYKRRQKEKNPSYAFSCEIRNAVRVRLERKNVLKSCPSMVLLGCPMPEFRARVEKLFWPGMSWNNQHKWHLDHIRPCADFDLTDPEQQKQCFHFSNWQPLWADDNGIKSDRLDWTPHESRHSLPERLKPAPFIFS